MVSLEAWAHATWSSMHYIALGYPEHPTAQDRLNYKLFFQSLGAVLPCKKCSNNYETHLLELPIDAYLINGDKLFEWTIKVHNIVNKENGKPEWTVERAKNHYLHSDKYSYDLSHIIYVVMLLLLIIACFMIWRRYK